MRLRDRDEASKNQQISETCTGSEKPNYTKLTDNVMFAYTVIRCTRHLIHSTRSAGTNHILVPSRVVVHNFGGFYHQSFYHRISDYTARRCCNSFMKLWRKPWRKKSWQFLPFWFNFSSIRDDAEVFSE